VTDDDYRQAAGLPDDDVRKNDLREATGLSGGNAALQIALQQGRKQPCKAVQQSKAVDSGRSDETPEIARVCSGFHGLSDTGSSEMVTVLMGNA
jgi:hypothetical protein